MTHERPVDTTSGSHGTTVERTSPRTMTVTRTVHAPAPLVFDAWTRPELLQRWWAPASFGITFVSCEMDVRTGGTYRFVFSHPAAPAPMAFFGRYLEVIPPSRLVWTNEESADNCVTTVTFTEVRGVTRVVMQEEWATEQALDEAIASGSSGTAAAPEQFVLLDGVLAQA